MGNVFGSCKLLDPFSTLYSGKEYEIRKYPSCIVAEIVEESADKAFWGLAKYFGVFSKPHHIVSLDKKDEKVSMIFPAFLQVLEQDSLKAWFVLPGKYRKVSDAPIPSDERITIRSMDERVVAVYRFGGNTNVDLCSTEVEEILSLLARDGRTINGKWSLALYNTCVSLKFKRKNEIHVPILLAKE